MRIRSRLQKVDLGTFRRIVQVLGVHLRPHRGKLLLSGLAMLGVSAVALLQPWPLKIVFDYVLIPLAGKTPSGPDWITRHDPMMLLAAASVSVLALAVINGLLTYTHSVMSKVVGHNVVAAIRSRLFAHVQRLPQGYHDYRETGDLMARLTGDVRLVNDLLVEILLTLASQILLILGMLVIMFHLDWRLALAAVSIVPLFAFAAFRFSGRIKKAARRQREMYGKMVDSMQESLAGIAHVKGFGQEKAREKLIGKSVDRDVRANVRTTRLEANYSRIVEILNAIGTALVLWVGALRVQAGAITPGDLLIFISYLRRIYRPLQRVARLSTKASKATVRGEKILELLDMPVEVQDAPDAISARNVRGDIVFENVDFDYKSGKPALRAVNCHIPAGKTTLVIGPTGAGKSTLAKLILRLYEPTRGRIRVDGEDIARYRIASLRKRITPLAQETFLFRTSIAENIAFGKRHATQEEVEAAARFVGADDFIRTFPEGYETLVGEGGLTLSGGQRQWISFARAALRRTPVMILDEPATGLDVHAEGQTKQVLERLGEGRTLIIITHRLHFLELADHVIFIQNGTVVEEGSPEELHARRGAFHAYVTQVRESDEESLEGHPVEGGGSAS